MFGIVLSDPHRDAALRKQLIGRLDELMIPGCCITDEAAESFDEVKDGLFMRRVCEAVLRPDTPVPADRLLKELNTPSVRPANALRRAVCLQLSLLPRLRMLGAHSSVLGGHMLGEDLLIPHLDENGCADCTLPAGTWTELATGAVYETRFRGVFGDTELPVLVRQNVLLPVGVSNNRLMYDEADRLTLHWYQPDREAEAVLADGTAYHAFTRDDGSWDASAATEKAWRLIVHRDGEEYLVR